MGIERGGLVYVSYRVCLRVLWLGGPDRGMVSTGLLLSTFGVGLRKCMRSSSSKPGVQVLAMTQHWTREGHHQILGGRLQSDDSGPWLGCRHRSLTARMFFLTLNTTRLQHGGAASHLLFSTVPRPRASDWPVPLVSPFSFMYPSASRSLKPIG